jgi:hypothetical protein|tara:strand:- start:166 stop:747 length:582 start_codon:yes stop_codon:yes gene_type:complete
MKNNEIENHIGIFPNAMSKKICKDYIKYFKEIKDTLKHPRYTKTAHAVSDTSTNIYSNIFDHGVSSKYINAAASEIIWSKYIDYSKKYSVLNNLKKHAIIDIKIQRTDIGEGYHVWHCENEGISTRSRLLAFMIYLNNVKEGGETEFLYQHKRIKAEEGKLLIWPAQFTHTHRGNMPISNTKYVLTGWIEYIE